MAEAYTISVSEGEVNLRHNIDRKYAKERNNEGIDLSRSQLNRVLIMDKRLQNGMTIQQAFNDEFSSEIKRYNSTKKKSRDKQSEDYYTTVNNTVKAGHKMKAVHEIVLQIGNVDNNSVVGGDNVEELADALDAQILQFEEDYPNLIIWYAVGHMDEGTYHVHLGYSTPVYCPDTKRGLRYKISQNECLENMNISRGTATIKNKHGQDIERTRSLKEMFYEEMKDRIEDEMIERGFTREYKDSHEQHLSPSNYKIKKSYENDLQRDLQLKSREKAVLKTSMKFNELQKRLEKEKIQVDSDRKQNQIDKAQNESERQALQKERERLQAEREQYKQEEYEKMLKSNKKWRAEKEKEITGRIQNEKEQEFQNLEDQLEAQNKIKLEEELKKQVSDVKEFRQWKRTKSSSEIVQSESATFEKTTNF